jgi:chromate transporter
MSIAFSGADWLALLAHFLSLSLLAIGGAITTAPAMHGYLVDDKAWLTDSQFTSSIALAQAAPGPNVLVHCAAGLECGLERWRRHPRRVRRPGGWRLAGVGVAMVGILLPSTTLTFAAARWGHRNREIARGAGLSSSGMAPVVIALLVATGWILASSAGSPAGALAAPGC